MYGEWNKFSSRFHLFNYVYKVVTVHKYARSDHIIHKLDITNLIKNHTRIRNVIIKNETSQFNLYYTEKV